MLNTPNTKSRLLERCITYADALNKSLEIFISFTEKAIDDVMSNSLRPIADAAALDRIVVFRVFDSESNTFGEIYRWDKATGGTTPIDPVLKVLPITTTMTRWISIMSNDTCINLRRSEFTEDEAAFLSPRGIKSILAAPIFIESKFWGVTAFLDNTNERDFDEDCIGMLRSVARLCASAVMRDEQSRAADEAAKVLKRRKELTDTLNKTAILLISQSDKPFEDTMGAGIKQIVDLINIDRFSIFRNFMMPDGLHASQIYRWERALGGTTQVNNSFSDVTFARFAPSWESIFAEGKSVNGPVRLMPEREAATLKGAGMVSAFATPVFINNIYWGFALFEDHHNERYFNDDYADMMRSASFLCTNTVIRSEMEREIMEVEVLKQTREADERVQAMFNSTPLACRLWSSDFKIIDCNDETVKLFKLKDKQEYMERYFDLSPEYQPDGQRSREETVKILKKVFAEGRYVFEWLHRDAAGGLIPCEITLVRINYKGENIIAGYTHDLRDIKAAQAKVREADERTQLIFDTAPIACSMFDSDFNILDCNQETMKRYGLTNKQVFFERFIEFSPEYQPCGKKSSEMVVEQNRKTLRDGYNHFEWMHQTLSGESMPCEIIQVRVKYKGEYAIASYNRDLREHKALLNEIHNENERFKTMAHWYESLLDAIPFFVSAQDLNGSVTFINATAETFLGKKWDEIVGTPCKNWDFSICDTENCAMECAKRGRMRTRFVHENEAFQVDIKMLKDLSNNHIGYMEVIQDITQMEHMAKQQAEAEAANSAKSSFLSAMSHEMRTPMNAIIGMAAIGKNAADIERKDYALTRIEDASTHLLGVINDILDMSKIEANKLELSHIAFDLKHSLHKAISLVQFAMEEKQLRFVMNAADNMPSFFIGDDQRLTQVITNLLSNAVKFTPKEGNITLEVSLAGEEDGVCELRFEVTDNGIGIASEQQERIFHAFEQAESGTTRKFGGTGLGLVISKRIIELMNGRIWVESELGKGARFIFIVKLLRDVENTHPQTRSFDSKDEASVETFHNEFMGKKLLIVEDIEINREILISLLDGTGLIIDIAENGKEAVDMVMADPYKYNLVFMDMQMPVMDGLEATRHIRALPAVRDRKLPIIAMTANVFQEDIDKCHEAGMDDHIGKPLDIANVFEKLQEYL